MEQTPVSLLLRISRSPSERDWEQLVAVCSPLLLLWSRRLGLAEADAADLVQDVMVVLLRKLPEFHYDPDKSFRNWLRTVATNKYLESRRKRPGWPAVPLSDVAIPAVEESFFEEREFRELIVQQALKLMQQSFESNTWKACWEHTVSGRSAAQIGEELGMSEGAVYVAKSRVLRRLREEFKEFMD